MAASNTSFCKRCTAAGHSPETVQFHRSARAKLCPFFVPRSHAGTTVVSNRTVQLPIELLSLICVQVPCVNTLINLSVTCRSFAKVVNNSNIYFWTRWSEMHPLQVNLLDLAATYGAKRSLTLLGRRGCELCGKARIRKVYPFGIRCCESCLHANTICSYKLSNELQDIPLNFNEATFWSKWQGPFSARFYWISQVDAYVKREYNVDSLQAYEEKAREDAKIRNELAYQAARIQRAVTDQEEKRMKSLKGKLRTRVAKVAKQAGLSDLLKPPSEFTQAVRKLDCLQRLSHEPSEIDLQRAANEIFEQLQILEDERIHEANRPSTLKRRLCTCSNTPSPVCGYCRFCCPLVDCARHTCPQITS